MYDVQHEKLLQTHWFIHQNHEKKNKRNRV